MRGITTKSNIDKAYMHPTKHAAALLLLTGAVSAQEHKEHLSGHTMPPAASAKALQQIQDVRKATEGLATIDGARSGGFMPVFGWLPTMGTHWVSGPRMLTGKGARLAEPSQLMFSPMNGQPALVGAAYAYYTQVADSLRPSTFDGNPPWHDHPDLAPAGTNLVMLHVWFVPSPDGPFAGHNPFLPFWGAGLTPPELHQMHDDAFNLRVRRAALALGEIVDSAGLFPGLARRPEVRAVLGAERAKVRALVPRVEAATQAKDVTKFDALMVELGGHWDTMRAAYFASVARPEALDRMQKFVDDMLRVGGGHGAHH